MSAFRPGKRSDSSVLQRGSCDLSLPMARKPPQTAISCVHPKRAARARTHRRLRSAADAAAYSAAFVKGARLYRQVRRICLYSLTQPRARARGAAMLRRGGRHRFRTDASPIEVHRLYRQKRKICLYNDRIPTHPTTPRFEATRRKKCRILFLARARCRCQLWQLRASRYPRPTVTRLTLDAAPRLPKSLL